MKKSILKVVHSPYSAIEIIRSYPDKRRKKDNRLYESSPKRLARLLYFASSIDIETSYCDCCGEDSELIFYYN